MSNEFWYVMAQILSLNLERAKLRIKACPVPSDLFGQPKEDSRIWWKSSDEEVFSTKDLAIKYEFGLVMNEIIEYIGEIKLNDKD